MFQATNFKKLVLASAVAICAAAPSISKAFPELDFGPFHPILGADLQHREMKFEDGFGDNLWKETYPQINLYAGLRFGTYFGLVVGHENSKTRSQTVNLAVGETLLGVPVNATGAFNGTSDIKGTYAQLMGYLPISFLNSTELFLGVGAIHNRLHLERQVIEPVPGDVFVYDDSNTHAKIEVGVQKIICNHFGLRVVGGWENTNKFDNLQSDISSSRVAKLKDTWTVGAGFFWIL